MLPVRTASLARCTRTLTPSLSRSVARIPQPAAARASSLSSLTRRLRPLDSLAQHRHYWTSTTTTPTMDTYPKPPVLPPRWADYSPARIPTLTADTLADFDRFLDALASTPRHDRTFHSIVEPLAVKSAQCDRTLEPALFLQYVSTDKDIRDASVEADKAVQAWSVDMIGREDVYEAVLDAQKHAAESANSVKLNPEEQRLLDRVVLERKRNGLGLEKHKREQYQQVRPHPAINSLPTCPFFFFSATTEEEIVDFRVRTASCSYTAQEAHHGARSRVPARLQRGKGFLAVHQRGSSARESVPSFFLSENQFSEYQTPCSACGSQELEGVPEDIVSGYTTVEEDGVTKYKVGPESHHFLGRPVFPCNADWENLCPFYATSR